MTEQTDLLASGATPTSLALPPNLSYKQWANIGATLQTMHRLTPMWLGDWLNYGERAYGETYTQAMLFSDHTIDQLMQYKWIFGSVPPENRIDGLTYTHYRHAAKIADKEQQRAALQHASENNMNTADFGQYVRGVTTLPDKRQEQQMSTDQRIALLYVAWNILRLPIISKIDSEIFETTTDVATELLDRLNLALNDMLDTWPETLANAADVHPNDYGRDRLDPTQYYQ